MVMVVELGQAIDLYAGSWILLLEVEMYKYSVEADLHTTHKFAT